MADYVIIGNSAGGIGAIEAIRAVDQHGSIAIVGDEPLPAYSRPAISELLCGAKSFERIVYRPESFYQQQRVATYFGRRAERVDPAGRAVALDDGQSLPFGRLLIATGGAPIVPPMVGTEKSGVFNFTTVRDAYGVQQRLETVGRRVVVIGAGLIGTSVSDALARLGAEVTVVELRDRVLSLLLDEQGSQLACRAMEQRGVTLRCGQTVREILGRTDDERSVGGVIFEGGERLACDVVIVAIGVRPRAELAAGAGIGVNRGIVVDHHMETDAPGIYACGDVVEAYDFIFGGNRVVPIWPGAYMGGRVAGFNMAGHPAEWRQATTMNALKYFGLPIVSAGEINVDGEPGYEVLRSLDHGYKKIVLKEGRLVGFVFAEDIERAGIVFALLRQGVVVDSVKEALIGADFDLIKLPHDFRRAQYDAATRDRRVDGTASGMTNQPAARHPA